MYLRCFQVILGKNTHGPRLAAILKFRKFYKGKRPKISKIDKFQRSFVAKGCVVEKKSKNKKSLKLQSKLQNRRQPGPVDIFAYNHLKTPYRKDKNNQN